MSPRAALRLRWTGSASTDATGCSSTSWSTRSRRSPGSQGRSAGRREVLVQTEVRHVDGPAYPLDRLHVLRIGGRGAVSQEVGREAPVEGAEIRRRDAAVGHHPRDEDRVASPALQDGFQIGILEGVHLGLADYRIALLRGDEGGVEAIHAVRDRLPDVHHAGVTHVDHRIPGGMEARDGLVDRAHPLRG